MFLLIFSLLFTSFFFSFSIFSFSFFRLLETILSTADRSSRHAKMMGEAEWIFMSSDRI